MGFGTTLTVGFNAKKVQRGLAKITSAMGDFGKRLAKIGIATTAAAFVGLGVATAAFAKSSSDAAMSVESLTTQFSTLLGSQKLAAERMKEIAEFASKTPFEIQELSQTSKLLQTMGGDLLATGEGLTLVGDAAALAGQPLQEVGLHIGRLFSAITTGNSAGESIARLQELGLISGKAKISFQELAKAQKKGAVDILSSNNALKLLKDVMKQAEGGMAALALTTEGKLSNMQDNIFQIKAAFGAGINDGIKSAADAINGNLPLLTGRFKAIGDLLGSAISDSVAGNHDKFVAIGSIIGQAVGSGMMIGVKAATLELGEGFWRMLEDVNPIRKMGFGSEDSKMSNYISEGKGNVIRSDIQDLIGRATSDARGLKNIGLVPNTDGRFRYAKDGESSPLVDVKGNKVIEILSKMEKNTRSGAKM